jgi:hypothetical protein
MKNQLAKLTPLQQQAALAAIVVVLFMVIGAKFMYNLTANILSVIPGLSGMGPSNGSLFLHAVVMFLLTFLVLYLLGVGEPATA